MTWLAEGWRLFTASPGTWIVMWIVLFLIMVVLGIVPLIGIFLPQILTPALSGGMLLSARDAESDRALDLGQMFAPLVDTDTRGDILILGLLYFGAIMVTVLAGVIAFVGFLGASAIDLRIALEIGQLDPAALVVLLAGLLFAALVCVLLALVVTALFFYAIPLVALRSVPPAQAIGSGVRGLLRNWLPLLVLGLIWTVLAIVATIPLGLGWLILGPVTFTAWYVSYRDIFERDHPQAPEPPQPGARLTQTAGN